MPHFFIKSEANNNNTIVISDKENYVHIARALRARVNERLLLIDENKIQYETQITEITKDSIVVRVVNSYESKRDLTFDLFLAQSPLRYKLDPLLQEFHTYHKILESSHLRKQEHHTSCNLLLHLILPNPFLQKREPYQSQQK